MLDVKDHDIIISLNLKPLESLNKTKELYVNSVQCTGWLKINGVTAISGISRKTSKDNYLQKHCMPVVKILQMAPA